MIKMLIKLFLFLLITSNIALSQFKEIHIPTRVVNPEKKYLKAEFVSWDSSTAKPVILVQTPYNKELYKYFRLQKLSAGGLNLFFDTLYYHYVIMDWRGFYANKSADSIGYDRGLDGYDAIEWIAEQKWCNGKVGTFGGSALGQIQFQTARHQPPHLVCAVPMIKDYKMQYEEYYTGGVLRREHTESREKLGFIPLSLIIEHPLHDVFWKYIENQYSFADEFKVPMLMVSGWFDHYPAGIMRAFNDIRTLSDKSVRNQHKLIMGPWTHGEVDDLQQGVLSYQLAEGRAIERVRYFFEYYMLGAKNGYPLFPPIHYYQLGEDEWKNVDNWDNIASKHDTLYLTKDGNLSKEKPFESTEMNDTIFYDPRNPSPSIGGSRFNPFDKTIPIGPQDIRETIENSNEALVFSKPVIENPLVINGKIRAKLSFSSDKMDTDFALRLCDVYPDGRSIIMTQSIKRARLRDSYEKENLLTTNEIYEIGIELEDIALTIMPGHSLRFVITSSNYPMYDINPNSGGKMYSPGDTFNAKNVIYFSKEHPSYVIIPTTIVTSNNEESVTKTNEFSLTLNTADGYVDIFFPENIYSEIEINIYNILGNKILSKLDKFAGKHYHLESSKFTIGCYFIHIRTSSFDYFGKFLIFGH